MRQPMTKIIFIFFSLWTLIPVAGGISYAAVAGAEVGKMFPIKRNNKFGYVDITGKIAIPPKFKDARCFSEGLAAVMSGGKWGYIDKTGKYAIPPSYDTAFGFSEGSARVSKEGKEGFIDVTGKYIIAPQFPEVGNFSEGLAKAATTYLTGSKILDMSAGRKKWGYIDQAGKYIIQPMFDEADDFRGGIARIWDDSQLGYINKVGDNIIPMQKYTWGTAFGDGLALVVNEEGKKGYIDTSGKYLIPPQFDGGSGFSEGLAGVSNNGRYGYIDKSGKYAIAPQFDAGEPFSDGLAVVGVYMKTDTEEKIKYGYIDRSGKFLIRPQFDTATGFTDGVAKVAIDGNEGWGYINKSGKFIVPQYFRTEPQADATGRYIPVDISTIIVPAGEHSFDDNIGRRMWNYK